MPGQFDNLKSRKRKSSSDVGNTMEISPSRRCLKRKRAHTKTDGSSTVRSSERADPLERLSGITCEYHEPAGRRGCSASPELEGQKGKENKLRTEEDFNSCSAPDTWDKTERKHMDCEENSKSLFPDDDSNQILPVEQFFGNLDVVQDFPQRSSAASSSDQRKDRKRHYYAREDSDEEVGLCGVWRDNDAGERKSTSGRSQSQ